MLEPYRSTSTISTTTSHRPNPSFWRRARVPPCSNSIRFCDVSGLHSTLPQRKISHVSPIFSSSRVLIYVLLHRFSCGLVCAARTRWLDDADLDLPSHTIYGVGLCWPGMGEPPLFLPTCWPSRLQTCCSSCMSVEQPICSALAVRWSTIRA